jgi:2-phospho-L-lactate transferase/gluconeogenesis factor (CofD/UPF0052 family)
LKKNITSKIIDLFLLKQKNCKLSKVLRNKNISERKNYLSKIHINPIINPELKKQIKESDIIIYGPGTQHSSLYPSYMTRGLNNLIENSKAKKFLITNIFFDNDIIHENVDSIIEKFYYFFRSKQKK